MEFREHMKVVGNDGKHVGTVDRVEGERIKLTKADGTKVTTTAWIRDWSIAWKMMLSDFQ